MRSVRRTSHSAVVVSDRKCLLGSRLSQDIGHFVWRQFSMIGGKQLGFLLPIFQLVLSGLTKNQFF